MFQTFQKLAKFSTISGFFKRDTMNLFYDDSMNTARISEASEMFMEMYTYRENKIHRISKKIFLYFTFSDLQGLRGRLSISVQVC